MKSDILKRFDLAGKVVAITGGGIHFCALTDAGEVLCWGSNSDGQLGNGSNNAGIRPPARVLGLNGEAIAISAGEAHTCALLKSLQVKCWGWNEAGQLGDGTTANKTRPVEVKGLNVSE